jgi:hypothetical protein
VKLKFTQYNLYIHNSWHVYYTSARQKPVTGVTATFLKKCSRKRSNFLFNLCFILCATCYIYFLNFVSLYTTYGFIVPVHCIRLHNINAHCFSQSTRPAWLPRGRSRDYASDSFFMWSWAPFCAWRHTVCCPTCTPVATWCGACSSFYNRTKSYTFKFAQCRLLLKSTSYYLQ